LRVTPVTAQPIVQIINGNEQHIWARCFRVRRCQGTKKKCEREKGRSHDFHAIGGHRGFDKC